MVGSSWMVVALLGSGANRPTTEYVDLIEINTCYHDPECKQVAYRQMIAYEWSPDYGRFHVIGWKLIKQENLRPVTKRDTVFAFNSKQGLVKSKLLIQTHTHILNDPERLNRQVFEERFRRGLFKSNKELPSGSSREAGATEHGRRPSREHSSGMMPRFFFLGA